MKILSRGAAALLAAQLAVVLSMSATAQHCPPIYQSFLSGIRVQWVEHVLQIRLQYAKDGGAAKSAYQAYLVAYLEKDAAHVPAPPGKPVLDPAKTLVLRTALIRRNAEGSYDFEHSIGEVELATRVVKHFGLGERDRDEWTHWHAYKDRVRLALFVPFLEDAKYSTLAGLPEDKHECNYEEDRALLFQTLPYRFQLLVARKAELRRRAWVRIKGDLPRTR